MPFKHRQIVLSDENILPLAAARNAAVDAASGDVLIFLDVDCIPGKDCIAQYIEAYSQKPDAVLMGGIYYLKNSLLPHWSEADLKQYAAPHPIRDPEQQTFLQLEENFNLFWTLSFLISRQQFEILGGFCEEYRGYGAEDTDFARLMEAQGIELRWVPAALAYHQYHQSQMPPYNHFNSIVDNAQVYYRRWGCWPMEKWLAAFARDGLIDWSPAAATIRRRSPDTGDRLLQ